MAFSACLCDAAHGSRGRRQAYGRHVSVDRAADSMRFTPVQFARSLKRVTSAVRAHLDEALARSFLSDDFKSRLAKLVAAHLKVMEGV